MWRTRLRAMGVGVAIGLLLAPPCAATPGEIAARDLVPQSSEQVLARAFSVRYDANMQSNVHITVRNRMGDEREQRMQIATKRIDDKLHSLGRFTAPERLRGTTVLNIEHDDRAGDHFVYLKTLGRVRRISTAQRADSFMGTDLTYEDFERRRVRDYEVAFAADSTVEGEPVWVVNGVPRFHSSYARAEFLIAKSDSAILEVRYFKRRAAEPFKVVLTPRRHTHSADGYALPKLLLVRNLARGTETEMRVTELTVNPDLDDAMFTTTSIEVGRPIPGLDAPAD